MNTSMSLQVALIERKEKNLLRWLHMWKEDDNEPLGWIGLNQFEDATSKEEYTKECLIPDSEK